MLKYDYAINEQVSHIIKCIELFILFAGVAQVLNREDGFPFDENDEQLFEVTVDMKSFLVYTI